MYNSVIQYTENCGFDIAEGGLPSRCGLCRGMQPLFTHGLAKRKPGEFLPRYISAFHTPISTLCVSLVKFNQPRWDGTVLRGQPSGAQRR